MRLLEFGLNNKYSASIFRRVLARIILRMEVLRADLISWRLKNPKYDCPPIDDKAMWERIKAQVGIED